MGPAVHAHADIAWLAQSGVMPALRVGFWVLVPGFVVHAHLLVLFVLALSVCTAEVTLAVTFVS